MHAELEKETQFQIHTAHGCADRTTGTRWKHAGAGTQYDADRVYFNKIEDWNTGIDFESQTFTEWRSLRESIRVSAQIL